MLRRAALALCLASCRAEPAIPPTAQPAPPSRSPAPMSHGEAAIDNAAVPLERTADAPPRSTSRLRRVRLRAVHVTHIIAPGVVFQAWTFDSVVPGPTIRVTVGDTVDFTLINGASIPHSIDFHAAKSPPAAPTST